MISEPIKFLIVDDTEENLVALEALIRRAQHTPRASDTAISTAKAQPRGILQAGSEEGWCRRWDLNPH